MLPDAISFNLFDISLEEGTIIYWYFKTEADCEPTEAFCENIFWQLYAKDLRELSESPRFNDDPPF